MALAAVALQQAVLAYAAARHCAALQLAGPGEPVRVHATLLALDPNRCLDGLAAAADWPFHFVAPGAMAAVSLSPRAACLAATLWLQLASGALLPAVVLCKFAAARPQGGDAGGEAQQREHGAAGALAAAKLEVVQWMADLPWASTLFAAQMCWMVIRTACMLWLPAS